MNLNVYAAAGIEFLGVIDTYSSLRWRSQVFDAGEFELHCDANENNLNLSVRAQTEDIIIVREDRPNEFALAEGFKIDESSEADAEIILTGRLGKAYLDRCLIDKTYNLTGSAEVSMQILVGEQMPRILQNLFLSSDGSASASVTAQVSYKNLLTVLTALSRASGTLFDLTVDISQHRFVFETHGTVNRSVNQNINPRIVFSDLDDTLTSPTFELNRKNFKNFAYVGGEGEGADRVFVTVDRTRGEPRREIFIDAKDIRREELSLNEYKALLTTRGNEKLDDAAASQSFESEVPTSCPYKYRIDYFVGDIISTHKNAWGILFDDRVTEVEEVYDTTTGEAGSITPTFGSPLPEKFNL